MALTADGGPDAATAIMTTDTHPKQATVRRDTWTVGGMAKGAGMLAPALATMLVVLTTDADVDAAACDQALRRATRATFDRLDSDGCMSTNDTVVLLASGASGATPDPQDFAAAVEAVCHDLAMQLMADAEGAKHDVTIEVVNAASEDDAVEVGRAVARSNLLKCAIYGEDPNWGRVLAAVGTDPRRIRPARCRCALQRDPGVPSRRTGGLARPRAFRRSRGEHRGRPARGFRARDDLDQRPHRRLRPRELGVLT